MYKKCLICGNDFESLVLRDLKMRKCKSCGLIWRESFDIPTDYYQKRTIESNQNKIRTKILDSKDKINTFKKYADLNNLCDVGCGEGIFLKTLKQEGYKNVIGIEPRPQLLDGVLEGEIDDFPKIAKNIHTVTMFQVIEHLENPKESLKLIYNNIKDGDKLIIETPNIDAYSLKKADYKHLTFIHFEHLFYFKLENISELLRMVGFKIIAHGKRDFDQRNLSIKQSLFRLGFLSYKYNRENKETENLGFKKTKSHFIKLFVKNIIRKILSKIVILLGRQDLIWIVAVKKDD